MVLGLGEKPFFSDSYLGKVLGFIGFFNRHEKPLR
jgi:hypothetical protein